ncbi:MAG: hypothetical protein WCH40_06730 [Verrucomicrobiales bacterium]
MKLLSADRPEPSAWRTYRIDPAQRLRVEEYQGRIGLEDLRSVAEAVVEDPSWSRGHHALIDFSAAHLDLTANDVLRLSLLLRQEDYRTDGWGSRSATRPSSERSACSVLGHATPTAAVFSAPVKKLRLGWNSMPTKSPRASAADSATPTSQ